MIPDFLTLPDRRLAYQQQRGRSSGPGMLFLGGYASDMMGTKAEFLAERSANAGISFLRFDYRGHGQSSGDFTDGTIGGWFEDACIAFDRLTEGPQVVIGSSMGGWIALLLALKNPARVRAVVGIAAGPDFTEDLFVPQMTPEQAAQLEREGVTYLPAMPPDKPLPVTKRLIEEARQHLLLRGPLPLACPLRLLQGTRDKDIPWRHALRIAEMVTGEDARVTLIKDGGHRLSRPQDLDLLWRTVEEFL